MLSGSFVVTNDMVCFRTDSRYAGR